MRLPLEQQVQSLKEPLPKGLVAVTADEAGRYTQFAISMQGLRIPANAHTVWQIGNDFAGHRNSACRQVLAGTEEWLWFIDDDHVFPPNILLQLLAHKVDIVAPLYLRRQQPFRPAHSTSGGVMNLQDHGGEDLVEVEYAGSSGMLIRRRVLEALSEPWFELGNGISEDVNFCFAARKAGFRVHVDMSARLGHITTAVVWPLWNVEQGHWLTGFTVADGAQLAIAPED